MTMTLDQALALCEHASPMPHLAGQALRVLRDEIARIKADEGAVTDAVVQKVADELDELFAVEDAQEPAFLDDVRRILTSVWPNPPAQAAQADTANWFAGKYPNAAEPVTQGEDGMQPSRPKPCMPVSPLGIEDFCFCNNEVSLQSVSGGGAPEGYLGKVRLKINGEYVSYVREKTPPAQPAERVVEGMVLVPEKWTPAMRDAWNKAADDGSVGPKSWFIAKGYKAMLTAAQEDDR